MLIGGIAGMVLFILGVAGDAPGLSLIGLIIAFLLIMWGVNNTGVIKKGLISPIIASEHFSADHVTVQCVL